MRSKCTISACRQTRYPLRRGAGDLCHAHDPRSFEPLNLPPSLGVGGFLSSAGPLRFRFWAICCAGPFFFPARHPHWDRGAANGQAAHFSGTVNRHSGRGGGAIHQRRSNAPHQAGDSSRSDAEQHDVDRSMPCWVLRRANLSLCRRLRCVAGIVASTACVVFAHELKTCSPN